MVKNKHTMMTIARSANISPSSIRNRIDEIMAMLIADSVNKENL